MKDTTNKTRQQITAEDLRYFLDYNPATGDFLWKRATSHRARVTVGALAGYVTSHGYRRIEIRMQSYLAHRLAWLYVYGYLPSMDLDHRDGDRLNNRIDNLREATRSQNQQNTAKFKGASSRYLGVAMHKSSGRWQSYISLDGKRRHLGTFDTQEEAYAAYLAAKSVLHAAQPVPRESVYER